MTVAIVGLANEDNSKSEKYIFDENLARVTVDNINAYLASGENIIVEKKRQPLNGLSKMVFGNMPRDGGHLIIDTLEEKRSLCANYPELQNYIRTYIGSEEFINGKSRYVFWLDKTDYCAVEHLPEIKKRVEAVKVMRLASKKADTQRAAEYPYAFVERNRYDEAYATFKASGEDEFLQIVVPGTSSENRDYVPMGFVGEDTIISNSAYVIYNAPIWLLGLLESRMHMVWLRAVGGRLETRYRYSSGLVYNTFPVPELSTRRKNMIEEQVFEILDLREELGGTLAELYHKDTMPDSLREAHKKLDEIVERAYKDTPFNSDEERLSHLLKRYKEMTHE